MPWIKMASHAQNPLRVAKFHFANGKVEAQ